MTPRSAVLALLALAILACSETVGNLNVPTPRVEVSGSVQSDSGDAIADASLLLRVFDTVVGNVHASRTVLTDAAGHFGATLSLDSLPPGAYLQASMLPPLGSGFSEETFQERLAFDPRGRAGISHDFITGRVEPPVPAGAPLPLTAALVVGHYGGQTVHPMTFSGLAYLDLSLTARGDSVHGRFQIDFSATTACGNGLGDVTGEVRNDTLFLQLVSDSFPAWDKPRLITFLYANSYTASADTLILRYPVPAGDCTWGSPAPIRLAR
jgi:hypothetical protein